MSHPRFPIVKRPIHSPPVRFPWMEVVAALIIGVGVLALSTFTWPDKREQVATQPRL
jgi:hypothetical protein